jgi:hypothetical protein
MTSAALMESPSSNQQLATTVEAPLARSARLSYWVVSLLVWRRASPLDRLPGIRPALCR